MSKTLLLQTAFSAKTHAEPSFGGIVWSGLFYDMLRLCYPRHSAYARAHDFDYWCIHADVHPEMVPGGWNKIWLILEALQKGYEYIAYLDTDAVVWDMDCDLRDALPEGKLIGACLHNPERSEFLRANQIPAHHNVGVLYVRNDPLTVRFCEDWLSRYPGHPRWCEQGVFNDMIGEDAYRDAFAQVGDEWNATVNVNDVPAPKVKAWHGVMPPEGRLAMMGTALQDDFIRFRV